LNARKKRGKRERSKTLFKVNQLKGPGTKLKKLSEGEKSVTLANVREAPGGG